MSCWYILPNISRKLDTNNVDIEFSNTPEIKIGITTVHYLTDVKKDIEQHLDAWDYYKKYTNTYEYIHTQIPGIKLSVSKHKPLSRSFFKFIEINSLFSLCDSPHPIKSFGICEGPGGFIEAITMIRENPQDVYYGMTLMNDDENTPGWKKAQRFLKQNTNVYIETGSTRDGNILKQENYMHCAKHHENKFDIITGDGGFDFSQDFNNQENLCSKLIVAQALYAITMQKHQGTFVLKVFDIFYRSTLDILFILSMFYNDVYIFKPQTSRLANSEKYVICKGFKFSSTSRYVSLFANIIRKLTVNGNGYLVKLLKNPLPLFYTQRVDEITNVLCQFQMTIIFITISLIKESKLIDNKQKINELIKNNISKCTQWCINNEVGYNKIKLLR